MDTYLVDYLSSSKAWVLVGSGPSIERGYPTWEKLAETSVKFVSTEKPGRIFSDLNDSFKRKDYPRVFEQAKSIIGGQRLIQHLSTTLKPSNSNRNIYDLIAQWPVPVYLTTNFDDEIQTSLAVIGEAYLAYNNSVDHLRSLHPSVTGVVFKLHGDLRSEERLILTKSQYDAIDTSSEWEYWRTKLTSIFQMQRLVIIGYSLSDPHIKHILEKARKGSSFEQPICWIAPDVSPSECQEYLENFNVRVIPYNNKDGQHKNLLRLLETVTDFIPKRAAISIRQQVKAQINLNYEDNSAAPGYFVFNTLMNASNFDEKRVSVMLAAIQSVFPKLEELGSFTLKDALTLAGWPDALNISSDFEEQIQKQAIQENILSPDKDKFTINFDANKSTQGNVDNFQRQRQRFILSLTLRIRHKFPDLHDDAEKVAKDIDASLTTYFKEGGLTLASALFSKDRITGNLPPSIIKFIQEASSQYEDILFRQAFFTVSVDSFVKATDAEREYLGRIAQGFFAFHAMGAFGDAANERVQESKETVWLLDSSIQIYILALASSLNFVFRDCVARLRDMGIRLFTTNNLLNEVENHLWFAHRLIMEHGPKSYHVYAAARGDAPYVKSNVFLEGFIRWQTVGKVNDWESYLYQIFNKSDIAESKHFKEKELKVIQDSLFRYGVEVVALNDWPGYTSNDKDEIQNYKDNIVGRLLHSNGVTSDYDQLADPYKKATPESEVLQIVQKERSGNYHMLTDKDVCSNSWFISETSMLNAVVNGTRVTWQPDAFLRFTSTLFPSLGAQASERAFEILLLELAKSGINLLDEKIIENVFSGLIDQAELSITKQKSVYQQIVGNNYGEDPNLVISRMMPIYKPLAAIQLSNEMTKNASERQKQADIFVQKAKSEVDKANLELSKVEKYRTKLQRMQFEKNKKKNKNKPKKK